jgi:hypothetical protein
MSRFEKLMKLLITRGEGPVEYDVDSDYSSYWSLEGGKITCHVSGKIIDLHDPKNEAERKHVDGEMKYDFENTLSDLVEHGVARFNSNIKWYMEDGFVRCAALFNEGERISVHDTKGLAHLAKCFDHCTSHIECFGCPLKWLSGNSKT